MEGTFFGVHAIEHMAHPGHAVVFEEDVLVVGDEAPEEAVPDGAPRALFVVGHFADVVGAGEVGLGGEEAAVGELAHAVDVGNHDPVVGVDEEFHEPFVNGGGMNAAEEHEIAEDHEAFDVVAVTVFENAVDGFVDRVNAGGAIVEGGWHFAGEAPKVASALGDAVALIHGAHELPPADDLADEALGGVEGDVVLFCEGEGVVDDFVRAEESDVESGSEDAVEHDAVLGVDGVLVVAEEVEAFVEEVGEPFPGAGMVDGVGESVTASPGVGEVLSDVCLRFFDEVIGRGGGRFGDGLGFREFFAVVFIEGPFAADGFAFGIHEDVHSFTLGFVEGGHEGLLF